MRIPWGRRRDRDPDPTPVVRPIAARDRFSVQDLLVEATSGIGDRPARLVVTVLGTVLGIGALVVTVGLAQTAAHEVAAQFDAVASTQVVITPVQEQTAVGDVASRALPWDSPERVGRLAGVVAAGLVAPVDLSGGEITAVPVDDPSAPAAVSPPLFAASPGLFDAIRAVVTIGRTFDDGHDARADRVAVLGVRAAERLGVARLDRQPSIFVGGLAYAVIGIVDGMQRRGDLKDAVIIPVGAARSDFHLAGATELQVRIVRGAGPQVAHQAPIALDPAAPDTFQVAAPAATNQLGENVSASVDAVFLVLGAIVLVAGGVGIANVTTLSVMERVGEIGLRRALGARRRWIAAQFVVESAVIGFLGGLIGAALGIVAVVVVSAVEQWTPVLDPWVVAGAPFLGAVVGLVAGLLPARRAARIEPIAALQAA